MNADLNQGLVSYWSFNEGTSTVATDFSGNGKHGTLFGNSAWTNGKRGKALTFDGNGDYVKISNPTMPTGDFTYAAWVKMGDLIGIECIVCNPGASDDEFEFNINDGSVHVWLEGDDDASISSAGKVAAGTWAHVVARRSGSAVNFWINGVQDPGGGSFSEVLDFSTCATYIGLDINLC